MPIFDDDDRTAYHADKPLSVAIYMHDLSGGGVERMRLQLIPALLALGIRVTLLLHARQGMLVEDLPAGVPVVAFNGKRVSADLVPLLRYVRNARPDVLMSSLDHNNIVALLAKRLAWTRTRLVICQHNALSHEASMMRSWKYRIVPALYRLLQRSADGIVAVSSGVADDLARTAGIPRRAITVIYNPVLSGDFRDRLAEPAPHPWFNDSATPVFLFAGRLVPQKDPETLLRAFALRVAREETARDAARLMILGDGPMREDLAQLARTLGIGDRVCFLGFQSNPLPYMRHAAALVLSSRYEGLGNVVVEALGCGTPVISTDCPYGPSEILEGGRYGRLVPVQDAEALSRAMEGDLRALWPAALLQQRASRFTAPRSARQHLSLFNTIVGSSRPTVMA